MRLSYSKIAGSLPVALALAGCATDARLPDPSQPLALDLSRSPDRQITADYRLRSPAKALHFPQELGGYRAEEWLPADDSFRWVKEGLGERVERVDGRPFRRVTFSIAVDYRALPKGFAPFSPFSEGSALIHSGQFHACLTAPCEQPEPLPITATAPGATIGVEGRRTPSREQFISRDEGTNIFIGTLQPIDADGFVAIIDPGLPVGVRQHLARSLPEAVQDFAAIYGPLSFTPELYVSIDDEPEKEGHVSTQGGTLPKQIFMHFDGENARERVSAGNPLWLDWFFAHEVAHLFQQDKSGKVIGDDQAAWLHEGGADAMAALAMVRRGSAERDYVVTRYAQAGKACADGLATTPLGKASAEGAFDLHYQCGLIIWLALDQDMQSMGKNGLHDLNSALFAAVRGGRQWDGSLFLSVAGQLGVQPYLMTQIAQIAHGSSIDAITAIGALQKLGQKSLGSN